MTQQGYIMDLIRAHDLLQAPQTLLPCPREWITDDVDQEPEDFQEADLRFAQRLVGEQLWLAMRCRPDIHHIVSYMASWVSKHPLRVSRIAMRVLSYLHKTAAMKMILGSPVEACENEAAISNSNQTARSSQTAGSHSNQTARSSQQSEAQAGNGGSSWDKLKIVGYSDASFAPFGAKSYGASLVVIDDSPIAWRCGKQSFTMLSIMESELYQATEAAVLIESVGVLIDELCQRRVERELHVDNSSAVAMLQGGPGSWRTRHLKVRSAYILEQIQAGLLRVEHIEGAFQRADLSTKVHCKTRLWTLLKLWRFENLPPEAEALLVARMLAMLCVTRALELVAGANGEEISQQTQEEQTTTVKIAGMSELVFFSRMVCILGVVIWELLMAAGKSCWNCVCRAKRGQKAKRLRAMARATAEAEVDRALADSPLPSFRPSASRTTWVQDERTRCEEPVSRSVGTQTEDWTMVSPPVPIETPTRVRSTIQGHRNYVHFSGPFFRTEHGDTIHTNPDCQGFRIASHQVMRTRLCNFCSRRDPIYQMAEVPDVRRKLRFMNTG